MSFPRSTLLKELEDRGATWNENGEMVFPFDPGNTVSKDTNSTMEGLQTEFFSSNEWISEYLTEKERRKQLRKERRRQQQNQLSLQLLAEDQKKKEREEHMKKQSSNTEFMKSQELVYQKRIDSVLAKRKREAEKQRKKLQEREDRGKVKEELEKMARENKDENYYRKKRIEALTRKKREEEEKLKAMSDDAFLNHTLSGFLPTIHKPKHQALPSEEEDNKDGGEDQETTISSRSSMPSLPNHLSSMNFEERNHLVEKLHEHHFSPDKAGNSGKALSHKRRRKNMKMKAEMDKRLKKRYGAKRDFKYTIPSRRAVRKKLKQWKKTIKKFIPDMAEEYKGAMHTLASPR